MQLTYVFPSSRKEDRIPFTEEQEILHEYTQRNESSDLHLSNTVNCACVTFYFTTLLMDYILLEKKNIC